MKTTRTLKKTTMTIAAVSALALTAACGGEESGGGSSGEASATASADAAADLVGPACADYAKAVPDGAGSVEGMAQDPVAVAASNNPLLTTLTAAVSGQLNPKVNLVDTLNNDEFTIFAPVDQAFNKLPKKTINQLAKPKKATKLTNILTYHVIPGRISPSDIDGEQETVNGKTVKVAGSGDQITVNDANVVCGGVQTANATVYLIDTVLMPGKKKG